MLEYQEISDFFKDMPLDTEQMEKVFEFMEAGGVDVLRITENADEAGRNASSLCGNDQGKREAYYDRFRNCTEEA